MRHVSCAVCSKQFRTLKKHLRTHNLKAPEYKILYPGSPISSDEYVHNMSSALKISQPRRNITGVKPAKCISCGVDIDISKFASIKKAECVICKSQKVLTKADIEKKRGYIDLSRYVKQEYVDHIRASEELNVSYGKIKYWAKLLGLKWLRYNRRLDVNKKKVSGLLHDQKATIIETAVKLKCSVRTVLRRITEFDLPVRKSQYQGCWGYRSPNPKLAVV